MSDIFLSYAREDALIAQRLASALEDEGWSVWWDRRIPAGKTFDEVIEEQVAAARCVVVLWSKTSLKSKWVKIEARAGWGRGILIPAALIKDMDLLPLGFRFEQTASLVGWSGEKSHPGYQSLIDAITNLTRPTTIKRRRSSQTRPEPRSGAQSQPQVETQSGSWGLPIANWQIITAVMVLVGGIGLFVLAKSSPVPLLPVDSTAHRSKVVIQDYGDHYEVYRNEKLLGTTPYEFYANIGDKIQIECRSNGVHVQTLTFDVGNNNVWSCRE